MFSKAFAFVKLGNADKKLKIHFHQVDLVFQTIERNNEELLWTW